MFQGAFTTEFYRALADALHAEVRHGRRGRRRGLGQCPGAEGDLRTQGSAMDLLLTHGYFLADDPKEHQIMKPYAPLGTALPVVVPARAGASRSRSTIPRFGTREELFRILETEPPATLGIYGNLMTRASVLAIIAARAEPAGGA